MARPRSKVQRKRFNLTLNGKIQKAAAKAAFERGESLSGMVERLLRKELASELESGK